MSARQDNATEVAQVLARLAPYLPDQTGRDLRALLAHRNATGANADERQQRLGLLVEMMTTSAGEIPNTTAYGDFREEQAREGENWPSHTTLIRAYGHWLNAVKAAMMLAFDGSEARVPSSYHHAQFRTKYRHEEVAEALGQCRDDLGDWPTQWEYEEWAKLRRKLARSAGLAEPRFPSLRPIRTLFGSFDRALATAKR